MEPVAKMILLASKFKISEHDELPKDLSVKDILIRSSNIGSTIIAQKIGEEKYKKFLNDMNLLNTLDFELDEVGTPLSFKWDKCKLETISFGHGITTTILQLAKGYAIVTNGGFEINPTLIPDCILLIIFSTMECSLNL